MIDEQATRKLLENEILLRHDLDLLTIDKAQHDLTIIACAGRAELMDLFHETFPE